MKHARLLFSLLALLAIPAIAFGQPPRTLSYQGVLTDTLGTPKQDGTYTFTFRLYEGSSGGTAIWTEQKTLQVKRGLFSTLLGDQVVIGNAIRFDRPYWLGIQLAADPEMVPRIEMSSVGYSRRAEKADTATYALSAPAQLFVDSARVAATIPDGAVTTNKIANNAVTSGKIASAQVVKSINTLKDDVTLAAGANVTITPSGSTLTIAASGGGGGNVSGTGAASQVPFWTGTSSISGDNGLVWDNTNKRLGVGTTNPVYPLYVESAALVSIYAVTTSSIGSSAVEGGATSTTGTTYGVTGFIHSPFGAGVQGLSLSATGGAGVLGFGRDGVLGQGQRWGVYGTNNAGTAWGYLAGSTVGVYGNAGGVGTNSAGVFDGNVTVNGTLSKSAGSFKIDHPLDPANKYLYHSFVESPDMMNVYNGNVTLDARGEAVVELPRYFEALNSDYRYQLTAIGAPGPNLYIAQKIFGNHFKIAGGQPGMEVSWQATGIRQDAFAKSHRIIPEVEKGGKERGKYLHPKEHGVSEMMGENYDEIHNVEEEQAKMKTMNEQQRIDAMEARNRSRVEEQRVEQQRSQAEEQRAMEERRKAEEEQRMSRERR